METLQQIAAAAVEHPLRPFWVGAGLVALLVQVVKLSARVIGLREHKWVRRSLPLAAPLIGAVLFGGYPNAFAVDLLLAGDALDGRSAHSVGALLGVGVGYSAMGVYEAALDFLEEYSEGAADAMRVKSRAEGSKDADK